MSVTQVLVIYSKAQNVRRSLIVLDHEDADDSDFYPHLGAMLPGEHFLYIPVDIYNSLGNTPEDQAAGNTIDAYVASQLGNPADDACAIVADDGTVINLCLADPDIDTHPLGKVVALSDVDPVALQNFRNTQT